ncbi:hypothetical protein [Halolactibacillus sp. JCM 19043]|uniref:hypothetical protein n=1 Tax=Halolactibacillus sp. JCM 19043 TaxID=1460638 RepID=UPI003516725F
MSFFRRKRLFTILISLIILVGLIGYSLSNREELSSVEEFIQDTVVRFKMCYYVLSIMSEMLLEILMK